MKAVLYTYIFAAMALTGCGTNKEQEPKPAGEPVTQDQVYIEETTDKVFSFDEADIPAGFTLDTIQYDDTVKQVSCSIYYFKGLGDSLAAYNKIIYEVLMADVRRRLVSYDVPVDQYQQSSIEIGPEKVYMDRHFINTQFVEDTYTEGANHHNYGWYSLNYSRKSGKMLDFKKEFALKTKKDRCDLMNMVGRNIDPYAVEYTEDDDMGPVDFFIRNHEVFFCPEYSPADGLQSAILPVDSLKRFLSKTGEIWKSLVKE